MKNKALLILLALFALVTFSSQSIANDTESTCHRFADNLPVDVVLTAPPKVVDMKGLPRFCQLVGKMQGYVGFETRLPLENWNGKFLMAGCGGNCGGVFADKPGYSNSINYAVARGFAATAHDGGHTGEASDTSYAIADVKAFEYWTYDSIPAVAQLSKAIVARFYGKASSYNYFAGCSNGGRMGFITAQRYPDLFDGIAAGASIIDFTGNSGLYGGWMVQHTQHSDGSKIFDAKNINKLRLEVIKQCDSLDGVKDGVISHPPACKLNFAPLACKNSEMGCFNDSQISHVKALYEGIKDSNGKPLFVGTPYGSEHLWEFWFIGNDKQIGWGAQASQGFQNLYYQQPVGHQVNIHGIDLASHAREIKQGKLAQLGNALNPDLSDLTQNKTKFLIYHGLSDPLIPAQRTVQYFDKAMAQSDDKAAFNDNIRMFLVPGQGHCWEAKGTSPNIFDPLAVLEKWVEKGKTPYKIVTYEDKVEKGSNTRLLCSYPKKAHFIGENGKGDIKSHKSYQCK